MIEKLLTLILPIAFVLKDVDSHKARQILNTNQELVAVSGIDAESLFAPKKQSAGSKSRAKALLAASSSQKVDKDETVRSSIVDAISKEEIAIASSEQNLNVKKPH